MACGVQPSEMWDMEIDELIFWLAQAQRIHGAAKP